METQLSAKLCFTLLIMCTLAIPFFLENARDLELIGFALGLIFWFQMVRYCFTREANPLERFGWLLFMIVVPPLGSLIYFFVRVTRLRG